MIQLNELDDLPDIPDFRRSRDKTQYSVKVQTYNAIPNENRPLYSSKQQNEDKTPQKSNPDFHPIQITQDDVVTGSNSVYGSQSLSNSGMIYAISQSQRSTSEPLVPAGTLTTDHLASLISKISSFQRRLNQFSCSSCLRKERLSRHQCNTFSF